MTTLLRVLNILLSILYFSTLAFYIKHFYRSDRRIAKYMTHGLRITVVLHFVWLVLLGMHLQRFPVANIFELASTVALAIAITYLYVEYRLKVKTTGFWILCVVTVLELVSTFTINFQYQVPDFFRSPWFSIHTTTVTLGYAAFLVSAMYGAMYLMLYKNLKRAEFGIFYRNMPSLEELSDMNTRSATLGFWCLTATIFAGMYWRKSAFPEAAHFDPIVISSYVIWLIYGAMVLGKRVGKWTAKSLAYLSISGFVVILLSMAMVNWIINSFHRFGTNP